MVIFLPLDESILKKLPRWSVGADDRIFYDVAGALFGGLGAPVMVEVGRGITRRDAVDPEFGVSELVGEGEGKGVEGRLGATIGVKIIPVGVPFGAAMTGQRPELTRDVDDDGRGGLFQ